MRIGLIGCGNHSNKVYAPSLLRYRREHPDTLLAGCCDINRQNAELFAQRVGFERSYTDYKEMLEKEQPDAVMLITPYHITARVASEMFEKGCPVFIEKPPGASFDECRELVDLLKTKPCLHQVAFNRRHIPVIRRLKRDITEKNTPMQHIDYQMYRIKRLDSDFYATAVHGVDLVCNLARGNCMEASFMYKELNQFGSGVMNILIQLLFDSGMTAQLSFCPVSGEVMERLTVTTDGGTYFVNTPMWSNSDNGELIFRNKDIQEALSASDGDAMFESNGFWHQLDSFFEHVREGKQPADSLFTCLDTMRLVDLIRTKESRYLR